LFYYTFYCISNCINVLYVLSVINDITFYFIQLNSEMNVFQRKFVSEVRRCDELERKLRYIQAEVHKDHVHVPVPESSVFPFAPNPREIINLEVNIFLIVI